jgi:hypothetical protein
MCIDGRNVEHPQA